MGWLQSKDTEEIFVRNKMERLVIKLATRLLKILINKTELSGEFEGGQGCKVCAAES